MLQLSHKSLDIYGLALLFVKEVYRLTRTFPKEEQFALTSQMRRAAISVVSNVAEGASRISKKERKRFYEISRSSLVEVDTQMEISVILGYLKKEEIKKFEELEESVFKILSKLISNININLNRPASHSPNP